MVFLREFWFVLVNVPSLAHRYENQAFWSVVFLFLSVASTLVKNRLFTSPSIRRNVITWIARISLAITGFIFLIAFVDLAKNRLPFDDLVCSDVASDAFYHPPEDKAYELVNRVNCTNRSEETIRNFAPLQDGYYEAIPNWTVKTKLLGNPSVDLLVHLHPGPVVRKNNFPGGKDIYFYQATSEFDPPLGIGQKIDLVYEISAGGTSVEQSAFSRDGTVFIGSVDYDTLTYHLTIHAPLGYSIEMQDWGVLDAGGKLVAFENYRQEKPSVSTAGSLLQWHVSPARRHLRYMMKYRFIQYGWS